MSAFKIFRRRGWRRFHRRDGLCLAGHRPPWHDHSLVPQLSNLDPGLPTSFGFDPSTNDPHLGVELPKHGGSIEAG